MKKIAKATILFGALALLVHPSIYAAEGMMEKTVTMETAPPQVQEEVTIKREFFRGLTKDAREFKLKNLMKELDKGWKPFMRCVRKGTQNCSAEARTVRRILASIMALVLVGTGVAAVKGISRRFGGGTVAPAATAEETEAVYGSLEETPAATPQEEEEEEEEEEAKPITGFVQLD